MKTKMLLTAVLGLAVSIPLCAGISFAESSAAVTGQFTIADTTGGTGGTLTADLSPGVNLSYATAQNEFALATANLNSQAKYRMEYGIWSEEAGYFQLKSADDATAVTDVSGATLDGATSPFGGDGWNYMGNSN